MPPTACEPLLTSSMALMFRLVLIETWSLVGNAAKGHGIGSKVQQGEL